MKAYDFPVGTKFHVKALGKNFVVKGFHYTTAWTCNNNPCFICDLKTFCPTHITKKVECRGTARNDMTYVYFKEVPNVKTKK